MPRQPHQFRCAFVSLGEAEPYYVPNGVGWRRDKVVSCGADLSRPQDRHYCERCNDYYCVIHADPREHRCSSLEHSTSTGRSHRHF